MRKIAGESRRHSLRRLTHGNLAPAALNKIAKLAGDHQVSKEVESGGFTRWHQWIRSATRAGSKHTV